MITSELGEYNIDMSTDLRKYARQTGVRSLIFFIIILFLVGDGLIWLFYGGQAAFLGALCMLAGLVPLGLIFLSLWFLNWIVKRTGDR